MNLIHYTSVRNFVPFQLGLEVKSKHVEELTEVADVVEIVDEDEQIQQEVRQWPTFL